MLWENFKSKADVEEHTIQSNITYRKAPQFQIKASDTVEQKSAI